MIDRGWMRKRRKVRNQPRLLNRTDGCNAKLFGLEGREENASETMFRLSVSYSTEAAAVCSRALNKERGETLACVGQTRDCC